MKVYKQEDLMALKNVEAKRMIGKVGVFIYKDAKAINKSVKGVVVDVLRSLKKNTVFAFQVKVKDNVDKKAADGKVKFRQLRTARIQSVQMKVEKAVMS